MTRPRVLFLTTSFPSAEEPTPGVFVLEHARAAAAHADVAVLHLDRRHDARRVSVRRDAPAELPTWRAAYPYRPTPVSALAHVAAGLAGFRAVRQTGFDPQLLHAHFFTSAIPGALLARRHRLPLVASEHWTAFLPEDPLQLSALARLAARAALGRARLVLPVSASLGEAMRAAGIRSRFRIVPNAVDVGLFHPNGEVAAPVLVTAGRLDHQKGVDVLLRALAAVRQGRDDVRLDVIGDGPQRGAYERLADELGVAAAVTFHGFRPKAELAELLRRARLFVLASRFDNNPCVLLEAQATGLPIVASDVGGIAEIVEQNGRLVPPERPDALADAIVAALADRYEPQAIAQRARERYSSEAVGAALAEIYDGVLAGGR